MKTTGKCLSGYPYHPFGPSAPSQSEPLSHPDSVVGVLFIHICIIYYSSALYGRSVMYQHPVTSFYYAHAQLFMHHLNIILIIGQLYCQL